MCQLLFRLVLPHKLLSGCTDDALHPVQGTTYDYTVTTTAATDVVRWFVLDNTAMELPVTVWLVYYLEYWQLAMLQLIMEMVPILTFSMLYQVLIMVLVLLLQVHSSTIQLQWKYFDGVTN